MSVHLSNQIVNPIMGSKLAMETALVNYTYIAYLE